MKGTGLCWASILRKGTLVTFLLRFPQTQNDLCRSLKVRVARPPVLSFLSFLSRKDRVLTHKLTSVSYGINTSSLVAQETTEVMLAADF